MKNLLFLGGTAFFGKKVVERLIRSKMYRITLLTRGNIIPKEFRNQVEFIFCDRSDPKAIEAALHHKYFDIIVDNSGRTKIDVKNVLDILNDKIEHYLFCSSGAVYPNSGLHEWCESEAGLEPILGQGAYANNKREAENQIFSYVLD